MALRRIRYGSALGEDNSGVWFSFCFASASLDYVALGEQTGKMAVDILNGAKAAETPVLTVMDSFTVINTDIAKKLGITIPDSLKDAETVTTSAE